MFSWDLGKHFCDEKRLEKKSKENVTKDITMFENYPKNATNCLYITLFEIFIFCPKIQL